jgi:hypothetical protein
VFGRGREGLWDYCHVRDIGDTTDTDSGARRRVRPFGFAGGFFGRNLDVLGLSVMMPVGLVLLVAGLEAVRASSRWTFTYDGAVDGLVSQLSVTGPAAVFMAVAVAANIFVGAVALRFLGTPPFRSLADAVLAGFAAAVVLDAFALFLLGSAGLFGWPELLAVHIAAGAAYLATRRTRPLLAVRVRFRVSRPAVWWLLVGAIWAWPLIVQLASPAVPFMDVLPNHVAPVEHVRVFGSFSTLTTSPSPIYGPSRLMLGYVAFMSQVTTITGLEAVLAEAAFAMPLTILLVLGLRRFATELFGGSAGYWVLLTVPLTFTFTRIPDARGTVVIFPIALWALSTIAAELRGRTLPDAAPPSRRADMGLAVALGASFLVHPLIGLTAVAAAGLAMVLYPSRLSRRMVPALAGGCLIAAPQVLTMGAIDAPAWVGAVFIAGGILVAVGLSYVAGALAAYISPRAAGLRASVQTLFGGDSSAADAARATFLGVAIILLLAWARRIVVPSPDPSNPTDPNVELMLDFPHLVWLSILGAAISAARIGRGWVLLGCTIVAGLTAWAASGLIGQADLTQMSVHYEVPKSIEYWLPVMLAIGAAGALTAIVRLRRLGTIRTIAIGAFLLISVYPTTELPTDDAAIGEHQASASVALSLREAELGFWDFNGYPDTRRIIDANRQQIVDRLRVEIEGGRLGPSTRVLNIASSFQQWVATPIGVFTGAMETSISLQPERSMHTVGGRLLGFDRLAPELAAGYGYVVLAPNGLSATQVSATKTLLSADGYNAIWSNSLATIYRRK